MPMNLGNPDEYSIEQFALKIRDLVGKTLDSLVRIGDRAFSQELRRRWFSKIPLLTIRNNADRTSPWLNHGWIGHLE
jgi:hypothetical protein